MDVIDYLTALIELEENAAELYLLFSSMIEEDHDFWWKLANEEMNHSALLKTGIEFARLNELPHISIDDIEEIKEINKEFDSIIGEFKENPSREKAFQISLEIESSAGESHYQEIMDVKTDNKIIQILQELNREDEKHYDRIKEYYGKNIF